MKKIISIVVALIGLITLASCTKTEKSDKIQVYTSIYPMYDFAKQIGGEKAEVHILCPPGQEPHDYEPTAKDIALLSDADVFIYNGMGMEHWVDSVTSALDGVVSLNTSDSAEIITANHDPHLWLNPQNAFMQMSAISRSLCKADPENASYYEARLNDAKVKIDTLIADFNTAAAQFQSNDIVVSHEAYSNLCDTFCLNQIAINGIHNDEDPSPGRMAEIEKLIAEKNIRYIFTEPLGTSSVVEAIAKDTDCEILVLDPFEGNSEMEDYFTVMYKNLDALKKALN